MCFVEVLRALVVVAFVVAAEAALVVINSSSSSNIMIVRSRSNSRIWDIPAFYLDSLLGQDDFMYGQRAEWKTRDVWCEK